MSCMHTMTGKLSRILSIAMLAGGLATLQGCAADEELEPTSATEDELIGLSTPCGELSDVPSMRIERFAADGGNVWLRVGIMDPEATPRADILYLHGYSDRFDNHLPLFEVWRSMGLRVIAFDYPSHGETCGRGLDRYRINGLAKLVSEVEAHTRPARERPLLVAGWSTGGLVAVRMLQSPEIGTFSRPVAGAMLITPGVDVRLFVGDKTRITRETLTSDPDPPHRGDISPSSPICTPLFSGDLVRNAAISRREAYPSVPTVVLTGGIDADVYARTRGVVSWVDGRQAEGKPVFGLGCPEGKHELDNESAPMRDEVRAGAASFARWVLAGGERRGPELARGVCAPY